MTPLGRSNGQRTWPEGVSASAVQAELQEWSTLDCVRTLYRRKRTLIVATGVAAALAALISLQQPRTYQAEATLEIQEANEDFLSTRDVSPTLTSPHDPATFLQTQTEMLQQDDLIARTVAALRLEERPEFQDGTAEEHLDVGHPVESQSAAWQAKQAVKRNLKVVVVPGSRVLRVVFRARDPQTAAAVANTLSGSFIEQTIESRRRDAEQVFTALTKQLTEIGDKLNRAEARLTASKWEPTSGRPYSRPASSPGVLPWSALQREVDVDRRFYDTLSQRANEARIASAVGQPTVRMLSPAHPPTHPIKPNLLLNLAIGSIGGLLFAMGLTMFQEQTYSFLRAPGEASSYLMLPELGVIPQLAGPSVGLRRFLGLKPGGSNLETIGVDQSCEISESFRSTLASILSISRDNERVRALVITSSQPNEGKTTVVSNLGMGLAQIGRKVLLIDGDMRRPRLHKIFNQANSWGLSNILQERNAIEELPVEALVKKTEIPNLYLLPSGANSENILGLLWSARMARLFPRFRREFEYVLWDAPPCLEFADARVIARYADQLVLVVRASVTDRRSVRAAVQRLSLDGIPVMGVVLNGCDPACSDLYGYGLRKRYGREGGV